MVFKTISNEAKEYFRQLEKTAKRLIRVEEHLKFNEVCLKEDLLPWYTNFNVLHDATARTEPFVEDCRKKLVERQIKQQLEEIEVLKNTKETQLAELEQNSGSANKTSALKLYLDRTLVKLQEELSNKHKEKLYTLYGGRLFIKQDRNTVINLSRVEIPDAIHNIMKLGMNTHLKTRYDPHTTKIEIEKLYRSIKSLESDNKIILPNEERLKCELKRNGLRTHHNFSIRKAC